MEAPAEFSRSFFPSTLTARVQQAMENSPTASPKPFNTDKGVLRSFLQTARNILPDDDDILRYVENIESFSGLCIAEVAFYLAFGLIAFTFLILPTMRNIYRHVRTRNMPLVALLEGQGWLGWRVWLQLKKDAESGIPGGSMQEWAQKIGDVFRIRGFEWDTVYLTNVHAMRTVLSDQKKRFGKAPRRTGGWLSPTWAPFLEGGMLVSDGNDWSEYNNATKRWLRKSEFGSLDRMETIFQRLLTKLRAKPKGQGDLQPLLNEYAKDAVIMHLMKLDSELTPIAEEWDLIREAADYCSKVIYWRFRSPFISKLMFWKRIPEWFSFNSATYKIHAVIDDAVEKALKMREIAQRESHGDKSSAQWQEYLDRFRFIENLYANLGHNPIKVRWEILELIAAGTDTTASLLTHALYELCRHPEEWNLLRDEIISTVGIDGMPTETHLKEMKWLNAVIKETLRFHPSSGGPSRFTLADAKVTLQQTDRQTGKPVETHAVIPKGTFILLGTRQLHHDVDKWGHDADTFRPQRWFDFSDSEDSANPYRIGGDYFKPFSSGVRACPGKNWALLVARYFLVRFCQTFIKITSEDPEEYRCTIRLGTSIRSGLQVRLVEPGPGHKVSFEYLHGTPRSSTPSKASLSVQTSLSSVASQFSEVPDTQTPESSPSSSLPKSPGPARSAGEHDRA